MSSDLGSSNATALSFPQLKHVVTPSSRSAQSCWGESPTTNRQMSSIYEGQRISGCLCSISVKRGLRYIRNKIGDRGDPCGIPLSIGNILVDIIKGPFNVDAQVRGCLVSFICFVNDSDKVYRYVDR